jgi:hypothetical protein
MKRLSVAMICVLMVSCAGWQAMTATERMDAVGNYYEAFINGTKTALPLLVVIQGGGSISAALEVVVKNSELALKAYRDAIALYKAGSLGLPEIMAQQDHLWGMANAINALVANLKALKQGV